MEALKHSEDIVSRYKKEQELCMNELTAEERLSRNELVEKVFILQQEVIDLKTQSHMQKEDYEMSMTDDLISIEEIKSKALAALASNFFMYNQK